MTSKYDREITALEGNTTYGIIMSQIRPGSTVLECGCATGYMTRYLSETLNCRVWVVEKDEAAFEQASLHAVGGACADLDEGGWTEGLANLSFDYIIFADVLEHLCHPQEALARAASLLAEGGIVATSIPNVAHDDIVIKLLHNRWDYTSLGLLDTTHVHFWAEENLDRLYRDAGLRVLRKDYVIKPVHQTEQAYGLESDALVPAVDAICRRPYGDVYQFVYFACRVTHGVTSQDPCIDLYEQRHAQYGSDVGDLVTLGYLNDELTSARARILELKEEEERRNDHIVRLDREIQERDGRILQLQGEVKQRNDHIAELDREVGQCGERIRRLQDEQAERNDHIAELNRQLAELGVELNNKRGHIELLLESDRELERIHQSRAWKVVSAGRRARDFALPPNTRRRLVAKLGLRFFRHPFQTLRRVDADHVRKFVEGIANGDIAATSERLDSYLGGSEVISEVPWQLPVIDYERVEDIPSFGIPTSSSPLVSIIVPAYNQFAYTYACLKSVALNSGDVPYEIIVADDCSQDLTRILTDVVSGVCVVTNQENLRFLRNCNAAAKHARGTYLLFLNNDTQVQRGWLAPLVDLIESSEDIGMVGSKLVYPDGRLQEAGGIVWRDGSAWNYGHGQDPSRPEFNYVKEVDYISGASIMVRRDLWRELGGFDEAFAPAYYEDTDLAFRVRARGYRVMYQPLSVVVHFEGVSHGTSVTRGMKTYQLRNQRVFCERWGDALDTHKPNAECVFRARERSLDKPTLLFVDHYVPEFDKDAGSRAAFAYLRLLVSMGFQVKFIGDNFHHSEPYTSKLQQLGIEVLVGDWYYLHWREWLTQNAGQFDYAIVSRPHIAGPYVDILREHSNAKIGYFGHDLNYLRTLREYETTGERRFLAESASWKEREYNLMRKVDVVYYFSTVEVRMIREEDPGINAVCIPVYVYDEVPQAPYDFESRGGLFFVGGFAHRPNLDAIRWLATEIMPRVRAARPDIVIHVAGSKMPQEVIDLDGDGIVIEGEVSDERLAELYAQSRMAIVPLRYGAGVKGKVVESMYHGVPVITTSCGAEGIEGGAGSLIALDTAREIADAIVRLYDDGEELTRISEVQRSIVRAHFSSEHAAEVLAEEFDARHSRDSALGSPAQRDEVGQ